MVDYRGLNEQTEHDSYSLPLIDSILQKQQKKRIFTVLDLKHGYHQMPLHPDSRPCTAMSTPLGPMQWKVVPMGAKNGNAAFQRMMEDLLGPVQDCADPFVDDIIIGSGTENMTEDELIDAHEKDLRRVLSELDKHNMVCKPTKASLFVKEVEFAGHVVGHGQRRPMPGKLASLHHWEKPQTISEIRSFMGFCNYYSGYVRMYAEFSGPLHKMLQVGKFDGRKGSKKKLAWTPEAEDAFNRRSKYWNALSAPSDDEWPEGLTEDGDKLFLKDKLLVPENRVEELIDHWHNAQLMHPGRDKMQQDLEWRFKYPPGYYAILHRYCSDCAVCRATKSANHSTSGNPVYTAILEAPMRSVAMDVFAMPEVTVEGETYDCVILAVDRHSGYIVAVPGKKSKKKDKKDKHGVGLQAKTVANAMIRHWLTIFDVPAVICSDRGSQFVGTWFKTTCKHMGTRHAKTVAYHSRSNG